MVWRPSSQRIIPTKGLFGKKDFAFSIGLADLHYYYGKNVSTLNTIVQAKRFPFSSLLIVARRAPLFNMLIGVL